MPRIIIDRDNRSQSLTSMPANDGKNVPSNDFVKISSNPGSTGVVIEVPDNTQFKVTVQKD